MHNLCDVLESPRNHPPCPPLGKDCLLDPGARKVGTTAVEPQLLEMSKWDPYSNLFIQSSLLNVY